MSLARVCCLPPQVRSPRRFQVVSGPVRNPDSTDLERKNAVSCTLHTAACYHCHLCWTNPERHRDTLTKCSISQKQLMRSSDRKPGGPEEQEDQLKAQVKVNRGECQALRSGPNNVISELGDLSVTSLTINATLLCFLIPCCGLSRAKPLAESRDHTHRPPRPGTGSTSNSYLPKEQFHA